MLSEYNEERIKEILNKKRSNQNRALEIAMKHEIIAYLREISKRWGRDDDQWLNDCITQILDINKDDLVKLRDCVLDLLKQAREIKDDQ